MRCWRWSWSIRRWVVDARQGLEHTHTHIHTHTHTDAMRECRTIDERGADCVSRGDGWARTKKKVKGKPKKNKKEMGKRDLTSRAVARRCRSCSPADDWPSHNSPSFFLFLSLSRMHTRVVRSFKTNASSLTTENTCANRGAGARSRFCLFFFRDKSGVENRTPVSARLRDATTAFPPSSGREGQKFLNAESSLAEKNNEGTIRRHTGNPTH